MMRLPWGGAEGHGLANFPEKIQQVKKLDPLESMHAHVVFFIILKICTQISSIFQYNQNFVIIVLLHITSSAIPSSLAMGGAVLWVESFIIIKKQFFSG